ncbi:MAG: DUF4290 domain-containing protein [Tannerellaceae bacterium]|jgi:hypothetical protein|nr:DUF4290 domain-containing protein [Tannerellaceae bacterium]
MNYNTELKKLALPEYGRNIHNMVDHCVSIADKEERRRCANSIISTMGNLFPHLRDINDFKHLLWDHLAIMSDFKLDIDYPYEVIKKENLYSKPPRIHYTNSRFFYRHYGKIIEQMIHKATKLEEGEEKDYLISLLANQMKKSYLVWNKESVEDSKIFLDLDELSEGQIRLDESTLKLTESREILARNLASNPPANTNNKKNHSRKNR